MLIALVAALGLVAFAAEASEPVVIESSAWTTTGTMKAKVNSLRQELAAVVTLEFGPSIDLPEGQFRLTVDDGASPFEIVGSMRRSSRASRPSPTWRTNSPKRSAWCPSCKTWPSAARSRPSPS